MVVVTVAVALEGGGEFDAPVVVVLVVLVLSTE